MMATHALPVDQTLVLYLPTMKRFCIGFLTIAGWMLPAAALSAAPSVTSLVPADAPVVFHVRSVSDLREAWKDTSFARAWADPEIQKFLAPMVEKLIDGEDGFAASIERDTGLSPDEFFALFSGEAVMAIKDFTPYFGDKASEDPQLLFATQVSGDVEKLKKSLAHGREKSTEKGEEEVVEEFQGESIHVTLKPSKDDPATRVEAQSWAIVDSLFIVGEPKSVVQEAIATLKKGGVANPISGNPAFAGLYNKSPDTHAVFHVGLDSLIPAIVAMMESTEGKTDANGNPTGPAAQLAQIGLTPKGMFNTLGLDALQSLDFSIAFREKETVVEGGVRWSEQRGLLRMAAFGEPPVQTPDFIPDSWVSAGVDLYSIPNAYRALMDTLAELSPMLDGMVRQQLKRVNTELGIDIERDLIGSLGNIMVNGYALSASGEVSADQPLDQFVSISLSNPDAFTRAIDALIGGSPFAQMIKAREYLGETIRDVAVPNGKPFAFSITRGHLLVSIGGPAMVESAIQGLQGGAARPIWKKPEVAKALDALPGGASSVLVADLGSIMNVVLDFLVSTAAADGDDSGDLEGDGEPSASQGMPFKVDAEARPSAATIAKYWSMMARGLYIDASGIRITLQMANGR